MCSEPLSCIFEEGFEAVMCCGSWSSSDFFSRRWVSIRPSATRQEHPPEAVFTIGRRRVNGNSNGYLQTKDGGQGASLIFMA